MALSFMNASSKEGQEPAGGSLILSHMLVSVTQECLLTEYVGLFLAVELLNVSKRICIVGN